MLLTVLILWLVVAAAMTVGLGRAAARDRWHVEQRERVAQR